MGGVRIQFSAVAFGSTAGANGENTLLGRRTAGGIRIGWRVG